MTQGPALPGYQQAAAGGGFHHPMATEGGWRHSTQTEGGFIHEVSRPENYFSTDAESNQAVYQPRQRSQVWLQCGPDKTNRLKIWRQFRN